MTKLHRVTDIVARNLVRAKENLSRLLSLREAIGVLGIMIAALFLRALILDIRPFQSDESIYVYSAYALTQGVVPYGGIFLAHPPIMYLIYSLVIRIVGSDFILLRLCNAVVYISTIPLTYVMLKWLLEKRQGGHSLALLGAAIYAFYPSYFLLLSTTSLLENLLTLFTLGSVVVLIRFYREGNSMHLFAAGSLMSLGLLSAFRAVLFVIAVVLFIAISNLWQRKFRSLVKQIGMTVLGMLLPALSFVFSILHWKTLRQFYLQTFYIHSVLFPQTIEGRLTHLHWYVNSMLPLIVTGVLGALYLAKDARKRDNSLLLLPLFPLAIFYIAIPYIFRNTFFHYFYYVNPYLIYSSIACFVQIKYAVCRNGAFRIKIDPNFTLLTVFFALLLLTSVHSFCHLSNEFGPYFQRTAYNDVHWYLGNYVANITMSDQKVWTSEGAVAFFAQRLIQPPNSGDWPFQPLFSTALSHSFNEYRGSEMEDYEEGFLTPNQFIDAWEMEEVKVLVFILGTGWVPYPDELLWHGFRGQEGVAEYVQENYEMRLVLTASQISYVYYVWVRK